MCMLKAGRVTRPCVRPDLLAFVHHPLTYVFQWYVCMGKTVPSSSSSSSPSSSSSSAVSSCSPRNTQQINLPCVFQPLLTHLHPQLNGKPTGGGNKPHPVFCIADSGIVAPTTACRNQMDLHALSTPSLLPRPSSSSSSSSSSSGRRTKHPRSISIVSARDQYSPPPMSFQNPASHSGVRTACNAYSIVHGV